MKGPIEKVTMIVDLQFGSTGKGLIAGYLAETERPDVVINANMPNAGHTYINKEGRKWILKVLPNGIVSPLLKYCILGGGSVFSLNRLIEELEESKDLFNRTGALLVIHENAVILQDEDKESEKQIASLIGSTGQGSAAAAMRKIARVPGAPVTAKDNYNIIMSAMANVGIPCVIVAQSEITRILRRADQVQAEGAQGFSLSINERFYPYCTSRDCTPTRFMADMGIPHYMLKEVVGVCRSYPIRVGGNSGGCYPDQEEIKWSDLGLEPELTTVTKKERRIFTWSRNQIEEAIDACDPSRIFYNFANYENSEQTNERLAQIEAITGMAFKGWIGRGPSFDDVFPVVW